MFEDTRLLSHPIHVDSLTCGARDADMTHQLKLNKARVLSSVAPRLQCRRATTPRTIYGAIGFAMCVFPKAIHWHTEASIIWYLLRDVIKQHDDRQIENTRR